MSDTQSNSEQKRRKVGVYERPAGADRGRYIGLAVLVVAAGVSVFFAYFFFVQ